MSITPDQNRTLYEEEVVILTCEIDVSASVDTAVNVSVVWSGPQGDIMSTPGRVTVSEVTGTGPFQSTLTLSSLTTSDSGDYTCTATADPHDSPFVTASTSSAVASISVGEFSSCSVSVTEWKLTCS